MKSIPIKTYPIEATYSSFKGAIAGALAHPLQEHARKDGAKLKGARLIDAVWTLKECGLHFDNDKWLHIFIEQHKVRWNVVQDFSPVSGEDVRRIGSESIPLDWGTSVGESVMDMSDLLQRRIGAEFYMLFINECGLLVYTKRQWILFFSSVYRTDTEEDMLYVWEDE